MVQEEADILSFIIQHSMCSILVRASSCSDFGFFKAKVSFLEIIVIFQDMDRSTAIEIGNQGSGGHLEKVSQFFISNFIVITLEFSFE